MANHPSAAKRARQALRRQSRNAEEVSRVHNVERKVLAALSDSKKAQDALSEAFSVIQKAKGTIHRNTIKRKMARLSKAVLKASAKKSA